MDSTKIKNIFPEKGTIIDRSSQCKLAEQFKKLPTYVTDFLVASIVDPTSPDSGIEKIKDLIKNHFVDSDQKELIKSRIKEIGEYTLVGRLRCRLDESKNEYWAEIPALGNSFIRIDHRLVLQYGDTLLTTGAWGSIQIIFDENFFIGNKLYPFLIVNFIPMQVTNISLETWIDRRKHLTDDEWIDLLISTIGFEPSVLSEEEKLVYLLRLVPFVESNVNLIELGPCATGKTFTYQSLSAYAFVISGSQTTVASLFYDKLRRQLGILGYKDVVMFDEFAGSKDSSKWNGQNELVDILKDFMNSGRFGRGTAEFTSGCSVVFIGNIDCDIDKKSVRCRSLASVLPNIIKNDRAFLDRIHGFIPGWKMQQIRDVNFSKNIGFMADYFSEIMHQLRDRSYLDLINLNVDFLSMGYRSQNAITKICCGLMKLIYPHKNRNDIKYNEIRKILDIAVYARQLVVDQLSLIAPSEFSNTKLVYRIKNEKG